MNTARTALDRAWGDFATAPAHHTNDTGFEYSGTHGDDTQTGTVDDDRFNFWQGGNDTLNGARGNDTFYFHDAFTADDHVEGGIGLDTLILKGDYTDAQFWAPQTLTGIETIDLLPSAGYAFFLDDGNVADNGHLVIDGSALKAGSTLHIDGSQESGGSFEIYTGKATGSFGLGFGDDIVHGGKADDQIYPGSGNDTVFGGGGSDGIIFNLGELSASDRVDGGGGFDGVTSYFSDENVLTLQPETIVSVEDFYLQTPDNVGGVNLFLTMDDGNVAHGQTLTVYDQPGANSTLALNFDGSAETDGSYSVFGGDGNDSLTGGAKNDRFGIGDGIDSVQGGGGNDLIYGGGLVTDSDRLDGGDGSDTLELDGDYDLAFTSHTITSIEHIILGSGDADYSFVLNDANVAAGATLTLDGTDVATRHTISFDASGEMDGNVVLKGGAGDDDFHGSKQADRLYGGAGEDQISGLGGDDTIHTGAGGSEVVGGAGADTIVLSVGNDNLVTIAGQSVSVTHDTIDAFDTRHDDFVLDVDVGGVDAAVSSGALSNATFNNDLKHALGTHRLVAGDAVVFTPNHGDLSGHTILVVDANGTAGYQSGDYVFELTNTAHLADLDSGNFGHAG